MKEGDSEIGTSGGQAGEKESETGSTRRGVNSGPRSPRVEAGELGNQSETP